MKCFLPANFFLISSSGLKGSYSTFTPPGWLERSISAAGLKCVPGMSSWTIGKKAYLWAGPFFCQSSQILSMKEWWRKNSGAEADSSLHMVPLIRQCTLLCSSTLRSCSKSVNLSTEMFKTSITSTSPGGSPLKLRVKQSGPLGGLSGLTRLQAPLLKGPSSTHSSSESSPSPPNPVSLFQTLSEPLLNGSLESRLQSQ